MASLHPSDFRLLTRIGWACWRIACLRRRAALPHMVQALEAAPTGEEGDVERAVLLTQGVLRRIYRRDFCLPQSLVLFHLLTRWGIPIRILFGVRREEAALAGHAWLVVDGVPLAERADPAMAYHVTYSYP